MYLYLIFRFCLISVTQKFIIIYFLTVFVYNNLFNELSVYRLRESSRQETFKMYYILRII